MRRVTTVIRRGGARRGQTMIELALMTPVLVLLLVGVFDFGIATYRAAQLTSAAQEGVATARIDPTATSTIKDHVKQEGPGLNLTDGNITITCYVGLTTTTLACSSAGIGDSVKVQATYTYVPITGRLVSLVGGNLTIVQSATSEIY